MQIHAAAKIVTIPGISSELIDTPIASVREPSGLLEEA
jgi:hypothetical protein